MRGMEMAPNPGPAQFVATRIQQLEFSFMAPRRSQWNCTLMRPYSSVQISSPAGPTTTAVCGPVVRGLGVVRAGVKARRSEEHTSELQSRLHLVCRLLLEKKKQTRERS